MIRSAVQRTAQSCARVKRVGIIGGTHGNELAGTALVRRWEERPDEVRRGSFTPTLTIANPRAVGRCTRYVDLDLNRCFTHERLSEDATIPGTPYEIVMAQKLNKLFGPKGSEEAYDVIIDLHNTTSNMGTCLMPGTTNDLFMMQMSRYVQKNIDEPVSVLMTEQPRIWKNTKTAKYLGKHALTIEIGPQVHGTLQMKSYHAMEAVVHAVLDFIELFNNGFEFESDSLPIYRIDKTIDFPLSEKGHPSAIVHPDFDGTDFKELQPDDPVFMTFDGETINYQGKEPVFPVFIAEAAYHEKHTAFWVTKKEIIDMTSLKVESFSSS